MVDDDPSVRQVVTRVLRRAGYRTAEACGGLDALARIDAGLAPDAVITDLTMPGMSGTALLRELGRRAPAVPALLLTGSGERADPAGPACPILEKPFEMPALLEALGRVLAR